MSSARDDLSAAHLGKEVERLDALDDPAIPAESVARLRPGEWDRIHQAVQESLDQMAHAVVCRRPGTISKAGRTAGKAFHLFSYRAFYRTAGDEDPIVVGVDCLPDASGIVVRGDIAGEESGQVYFEIAEAKYAPAVRDEVVAAVREVAAALVDQASFIVQILDQN